MIAKIAVKDVDKIFDYALPDELQGASPGARVLIPFGVGNRFIEGIIIALADKSEYKRLKKVAKLIDNVPLCTPDQINLALWLRDEYFCTYYAALKCVMPPGLSTKIKETFSAVEKPPKPVETLDKYEEKVLARLRDFSVPVEWPALADLPRARTALATLAQHGLVTVTREDTQKLREKRQRLAELAISENDAVELLPTLSRKAPIQAKMLEILLQAKQISTADLAGISKSGYSALRAMENKGLVRFCDIAVTRHAFLPEKYRKTTPHKATREQKAVLAHLKTVADSQKPDVTLLRGVTGSGKTEVFLQTIDYVIAQGRQAIVMVPEISLTPQMVERFVGRFGERVSVLHSSLSLGERYDEWQKIMNSQVDVVVGARSAIFAPFSRLGIIIVDEEQETTYKSGQEPRYHTIEVARHRAESHNAQVLLASATPSIDSYYRAKSGEYHLFEMLERYNQSALPAVDVVDMRAELVRGNRSIFSKKLAVEIQKNITAGQQTILFLNRRGFNTFVSCRSCGESVGCPNCNVTLTYHKNQSSLVCHYCGYTIPNPYECPECGSPYIRYFGDGTERIEEEIAKIVPHATTIRMDMDTTSNKNSHEAILSRFRDEKIDILVGTQMVTKGLDFKNVTLVGVIAADLALNLPDFRALERTFSLITQVCGRAGRGDLTGRAIIQTYQPDHFVIRLAKAHNYTDFYKDEILLRKSFKNPPFCDIILILATGENGEIVLKCLQEAVSPLLERFEANQPAPAPIARIKGQYRFRCLIKCDNRAKIAPYLREIVDNYGSRDDVKISVEINPVSML